MVLLAERALRNPDFVQTSLDTASKPKVAEVFKKQFLSPGSKERQQGREREKERERAVVANLWCMYRRPRRARMLVFRLITIPPLNAWVLMPVSLPSIMSESTSCDAYVFRA